MNTNEREIVIRQIWPGNAGVPPACAGETPALPRANLRFAPPIAIFTGPKPILFAKAADSFLHTRRVPLT